MKTTKARRPLGTCEDKNTCRTRCLGASVGQISGDTVGHLFREASSPSSFCHLAPHRMASCFMASLPLHADSHSPKLFIPVSLRAVVGLGTAMSTCYTCQCWDGKFLLCRDGDGPPPAAPGLTGQPGGQWTTCLLLHQKDGASCPTGV